MDKPNPTRLFVSGVLSFVLMGALPGLYGVSLPLYRRLFDLEPGQGGALLAANAIGAFLAVLAGVFGLPGVTARTSLGLMAIGAGLMTIQANWPLTLMATLVLGMGFGMAGAVFNRRFLAEFGGRGPGMVGLLNATFGIGAIASPILFVLAGGSPQLIFAAIAVLSALTILVIQPSGHRAAAQPGPGIWTRREATILLLLFVAAPLEAGLSGFGPSALIARGTDEVAAAGFTSGFFAAFLLGRLSLVWLTRWFDPAHLFLGSLAGVSLCSLFAMAGTGSIGFVLSGAPVGMMFPTFFIWASNRLGRDASVASAILAAGLSGGAVGPLLLGPILSSAGLGGLFVVMAVLGVAVTLVTLIALLYAPRPDLA